MEVRDGFIPAFLSRKKTGACPLLVSFPSNNLSTLPLLNMTFRLPSLLSFFNFLVSILMGDWALPLHFLNSLPQSFGFMTVTE